MSNPNKKTSSAFAILQKVGRSFMFPIALLPVAGLLLGIGSSFTNETTLTTYHLMDIMGPGTFIYNVFLIFSDVGQIVFSNLALLFAMGVAIGLANNEKAIACLSAAVAFLTTHQTVNTMLKITGKLVKDASGNFVESEAMLSGSTDKVLGITSLQMGVFGGIVVGIMVAALHNKFYKIELPSVISFFGGVRFVPIVSVLFSIPLGVLFFFVWPYVQTGIYSLGNLVNESGYAGTFIYGYIERALIPFGLHHVFYLPFWQTGLGGTQVVQGVTVQGAQNIFFAQLADPSVQHFDVEATKFMAGKFPFMMFGLPGAALAMYTCAKDKKKKAVGGLLLSAALTSFLTGITEPLEFTFLFVSPILYYCFHCVFAGLSFMLMHILNVGVGMTFSGGMIDLTLFGILQGNAKTNWVYIVLVGIVYFFVYFFVFKFIITKLDLKTPGREDSDDEETKLYSRSDVDKKTGRNTSIGSGKAEEKDEQSALILEGLGGADNIIELDCCATRLRLTVKDETKVNDSILKKSGAAGVIKSGGGIQIIYGPKVTVIKSKLEEYISK